MVDSKEGSSGGTFRFMGCGEDTSMSLAAVSALTTAVHCIKKAWSFSELGGIGSWGSPPKLSRPRSGIERQMDASLACSWSTNLTRRKPVGGGTRGTSQFLDQSSWNMKSGLCGAVS